MVSNSGFQDSHLIECCCGGKGQRFFWTILGARDTDNGQMERFIHRHYLDGFILPIHSDMIEK